jgi:hypothetical protein
MLILAHSVLVFFHTAKEAVVMDFVPLEVEETDMSDLFDSIEEPEVVPHNGHYGTLDPKGFHEAPPPSLADEMRRNPVLALENRKSRAEAARCKGKYKIAEALDNEAGVISAHLKTLSKADVSAYKRMARQVEEVGD